MANAPGPPPLGRSLAVKSAAKRSAKADGAYLSWTAPLTEVAKAKTLQDAARSEAKPELYCSTETLPTSWFPLAPGSASYGHGRRRA